jgi:archaemetzincin
LITLRFYRFANAPQTMLTGLREAVLSRLPKDFVRIQIQSAELSLQKEAFIPSRGQYLADPFLSFLNQHIPPGEHGLALANLDLFVSGLNFVFGVAQFGGNALVALPRLNPVFYGLPEAPELFFQRTAKETLHELGHVFGLEHCRNSCVMRFSNFLGDTDDKPDSYCPDCLAELER